MIVFATGAVAGEPHAMDERIGLIGHARLTLARILVPGCYAVVPRDPTKAMLKAACASMSPGKRPTQDWVPVMEKHRIRYGAMIAAVSRS